jgi:hypothetical protein
MLGKNCPILKFDAILSWNFGVKQMQEHIRKVPDRPIIMGRV